MLSTQNEVFLFPSATFLCSVLSPALTYSYQICTFKCAYHNGSTISQASSAANLIFSSKLFTHHKVLKDKTYFFNNKICSRLRILWTSYLSHHHFPRLHNFLWNQNCQHYKIRTQPHIHVSTYVSKENAFLKANIRKVECIHIAVILGKYKASNLKKKMYKFSTLFKIFVSAYYELKLKGFSHLEIFLNKYKAINLGSDLMVSIKKKGKIMLWAFIVNTTPQPSLQHFVWWVLQFIFQYNNGFLAFRMHLRQLPPYNIEPLMKNFLFY